MSLRLICCLTTLVLLIKWTSCTYEPWEGIKTWHNDIEHDKDGAETRHVEMEKNCSDIHGEDEICFDECMFRTQYKIIGIDDDKYYSAIGRNGLKHLDQYVLGVTESAETVNKFEINLYQSCGDDGLSLKDLGIDYQYEMTDQLCSEIMNGSGKDDFIEVINCLKLAFKKS